MRIMDVVVKYEFVIEEALKVPFYLCVFKAEVVLIAAILFKIKQ